MSYTPLRSLHPPRGDARPVIWLALAGVVGLVVLPKLVGAALVFFSIVGG